MSVRQGDFTRLAADYSAARPDYAPGVLDGLIGLTRRPAPEIDAVDVGAGTGIWSRMLSSRGLRSVVAIEPNDEMRANGIRDSAGHPIVWRAGSGEATGMPDGTADLPTMASAFHWVDFNAGMREFRRVLRPGGWFVALWNPRLIEANPLFVEIEAKLRWYRPDLDRVSSGRAGITATLTDRLWATPGFDDVIHLEGRHVITMTTARYMTAWRSVNDLQAQLGPEAFAAFLDHVAERTSGLTHVEVTYQTRAWAARRAP
jgi:SAM-dependent methyltransferase